MTLHLSTLSLTARPTLTLRDVAPVAADAPQIVDSTALLQGQRTVGISHNGAVYRLQSTKLGKLILTK
jgi:hemin uptake protein HemP